MEIYVLSDLHIEFNTYDYVINNIPSRTSSAIINVLVIAGDICPADSDEYQKLLSYVTHKFDHVIIIAGNHEYYSIVNDIDQTNEIIRKSVSNYQNIHFLNRSSVTIGDVRFLGCVLWSDISNVTTDWYPISDMRSIRNMNPVLYQSMYETDRSWLEHELSQTQNLTIVITHHLPSIKCIHPQYKSESEINHYFYSNLDHIVSQASLWIAGHTHQKVIANVNNTIVVVNPLGYPDEMNEFNHKLKVVVKDDQTLYIVDGGIISDVCLFFEHT